MQFVWYGILNGFYAYSFIAIDKHDINKNAVLVDSLLATPVITYASNET